ncbi:type II CAAX endopeptidase family protein [Dactylosporangium maewongense]|uniref:Type II CAAX endopeptidase family protein n=1 Tax=Dactylosporangium maewongense TaxID=634393 RepID=A0ABN1ZNC3_9ACTN
MRSFLQLAAVFAVSFLGSLVAGGNPWLTLLAGTATAVLALVVYVRIGRRPSPDLPREGAAVAFGRGAVLGAALFTAVIAVIALLGGYRVEGWGSLSGAAALLGLMLAAAVTEELIFRGVLFRVVEARTGTWTALALTGALFGLMHLLNPHASLWGAVAIAIEAGGMLGAAYAATRTLWLPIGLHWAWNFAEAGVFGTDVSGNDTAQGLLDGALSGPVLLSGGTFGPEASLASVVGGVMATVAFMALARRRGRVLPRRSRRPAATLSR